MGVERIEIEDPAWMQFVGQQDQATIFHSPAWCRVLTRTYSHPCYALTCVDPRGNITAGVPFAQLRGSGRTERWVSLPFSDHCAPLSHNTEAEITFMRYLTEVSRQGKIQMEMHWRYPESAHLISKVEYVLHCLPLTDDFKMTQNRIHSMHLRNARTAEKRGVRVVRSCEPESLELFYQLHLRTRRRQGQPVQPIKFFRQLAENLLKPGHGFVLLAYHDATCIAGAFFLYWNHTLTYKFGASDPEGQYLRPNDLIFLEAIRWGCEHGFTRLDFGRTDLNNLGLRDYKARWGAVETDLYTTYGPFIPSRRPGWVMNAMTKTIQHSPLWVCRTLGELFYRYAI